MKTTTKISFTSKKGVTINKGEKVSISFNVKGKDSLEFLPNYIRLTTQDGRSIVTRRFESAGLRVPGIKTLERYSFDGEVRSVFGEFTEPDGWDSIGSPSWLLALSLI